MKPVIVYAHPQTEGHCSFLLKQIRRMSKGHILIDLYKESYDPVLHESEHYTSGNKEVAGETRRLQDLISQSEPLVFIYPVWWGSMPAVLKGFFDRVMLPGFAYRYVHGVPVGLLKGKRAIVFQTLGGPLLYYWVTGNRPKKSIQKDILGFCGVRAKVHQFGRCRTLDGKKKKEMLRAVRRAF